MGVARLSLQAIFVTTIMFSLSVCNAADRKHEGTASPQTTVAQTDIVAQPSTSSTDAAPQTPAPGCDAPSQRGGRRESIHSGDLDRSYLLHIPKQYDGSTRLPLVINLHGFGSNAIQQAAYSRLPVKGDEAGFVVVTPDGAGTPQRWSLGLPGDTDDISFIRDLLDHLEATLCIDASRVYAAGISNGSAFSQRLACALAGRIAAVAAVAALAYPVSLCGSAPPVPLIAFHGTADPCVPYGGGTTNCGLMLPVPSVDTAAADWAKHDGCDATPATASVTAHVRTIAYSDCAAGAAVVVYVVEGGGHTWPGSIPVPALGATSDEIDATDLLWEFFQAHTGSQ